MRMYEFLYADGSYYTLMECDDPQKELDNIQLYSPDVMTYQEYIEPIPESETEEVDESAGEEAESNN